MESDLYWRFNPIFSPKVPYFTFPDFNQYTKDILPKIKQSSITIIDASLDPHDPIAIKNLCCNYDIDDKVVILTSNFGDYRNYRNIEFFPFQFFRSSFYYKKVINEKRNFFVSCINRNPAGHKLYTFYKLNQHPRFKEMLTSFNGMGVHGFNRNRNIQLLNLNHYLFDNIPDDIKIKIEQINIKKQAFPGDDIFSYEVLNSNLHPAYTDAYLNLVTETSADVPCISEKTFKPIVSGQLFLISGAVQLVECLRSLDFDCFDDIFSNHDYTNHKVMIQRIDRLFDIFSNLYDQIPDIYHDCKKRIRENQNHMWSSTLYNKIVSPLKEYQILK